MKKEKVNAAVRILQQEEKTNRKKIRKKERNYLLNSARGQLHGMLSENETYYPLPQARLPKIERTLDLE